MSSVIFPGENEPLFYFGEFPVRLITLLVAFHSGAMIAASLIIASGHGALLDILSYSSTAVSDGQVWRLFTYAFVAGPSIWFLFEMLMLYYFGREVENGLGWKRFGILYAGLIFLGPILLQALGSGGTPQNLVGAQQVNFAVFAAFVAMHPGAQFFFGLAARWVFLGLLAISSLQHLADHQPMQVMVLISSCLLAFMLMRRAGFEEPMFGYNFSCSLPRFGNQRRETSPMPGRRSPSGGGSATATSIPQVDPELEMDRLLEKIGRKGIGSLSVEERNSLEQARRAILQRSGGKE
jgi:membrane associated rhomboid family serine protease